MGMAASQARFLGLTARKSNIEFQGQQINQARTALANKVMGLYNKYNDLKVPTAPSKYDYVSTKYSFESTYENYEISNFSKITDGENKGFYALELSYDYIMDMPYTKTFRDTAITAKQDANGDFSYIDFVIGTDKFIYNADSEETSNITKITANYENYPGLAVIMKQQGLEEGVFYAFEMNNVTYYTSENDLKLTAFTPQGDNKNVYYGDYTFDYKGTITEAKKINAVGTLTQSKDGRMSAINIIECEDDKDLVGKQYRVDATQYDDEIGYQDAVNRYTYEHDKYEKKLADLNAQIEKIQTQDKALELKLRQLDTEQKAVSTEMETVQGVIKDTVEKLFKGQN